MREDELDNSREPPASHKSGQHQIWEYPVPLIPQTTKLDESFAVGLPAGSGKHDQSHMQFDLVTRMH